jgi:hypothetical protein
MGLCRIFFGGEQTKQTLGKRTKHLDGFQETARVPMNPPVHPHFPGETLPIR